MDFNLFSDLAFFHAQLILALNFWAVENYF